MNRNGVADSGHSADGHESNSEDVFFVRVASFYGNDEDEKWWRARHLLSWRGDAREEKEWNGEGGCRVYFSDGRAKKLTNPCPFFLIVSVFDGGGAAKHAG